MTQIKKIIIVDDEPKARINLRMLIENYTDWKIVLELDNGLDLETYVNQLKPDLIFLDVRMPKRNGISAAQGLLALEEPPLIVFTSAYSDYALEAFEVYAADYLLKPLSDDRFLRMIERLEKMSKTKPAEFESPTPTKKTTVNETIKKYLSILIIRSVGLIQVVDLNDVLWFRSCGNYVEVILENEKYLHRVSLGYLEENLNPNIFARCHRGAIVKISSIKEIRSEDESLSHVILKNGDSIKLSQTYKDSLIACLEK